MPRRRNKSRNNAAPAGNAGTSTAVDSLASPQVATSAEFSSANSKASRKKFNLEEAYANHRRRQHMKGDSGGPAPATPKNTGILEVLGSNASPLSRKTLVTAPSDISDLLPVGRVHYSNGSGSYSGDDAMAVAVVGGGKEQGTHIVARLEKDMHPYDDNATPKRDISDWPDSNTCTVSESAHGPRKAMSTSSIKKDESRMTKIAIRLFFGILMVVIFASFVNLGHIYLCGLIFFTEFMLYRELVKVRYNTFFHIIEETIPLFRTTQWMWFVTAIFYTYGDFVVEVIKSNTSLHYLLKYARLQGGVAFLLYSATFVTTIATMQKDFIRFQLNQLCWSILVLCLTVGQLKYIMHNVYNGLFWFALPIMLVVFNDSFAWLAGVTCGRKFIHREFISLSPSKTWEGFIGGWIGTMIAGWHLSRFMAQYTWMACPTNSFSLFPSKLECELDPVFLPATNIIPSQIFDIFPTALVQMIPGAVRICMVDGNQDNLTACVSGEVSHTHHHFNFFLKNVYPVQIHALGLSLFASFVAPFGGFLASGIKRAYGLKDFASFIPGHGGMMDRMDCQLLMALCTWVHYNTFVKMATVSVPKMIYMYKLMKDTEREEFLAQVAAL
mmetsp:Transcript_4759/g.6974  ORF Transcript_4759/g.6974 Transcript_4759/m.6974 type:complete len:611 (-) Transcript_4759:106-1938(-)